MNEYPLDIYLGEKCKYDTFSYSSRFLFCAKNQETSCMDYMRLHLPIHREGTCKIQRHAKLSYV